MRKSNDQRSLETPVRGALVWVVALAMIGCRIGGPTDEADLVPDGDGGGAAADATTTADASGSTPGTHEDSSAPATDDAGGGGIDAALPDGGAGDSAPPTDSGGGPDPGDGACSPTAPVQVCDPVCNTGCAGLTRCDVSDTPSTGTCIGIWIQGVGTGCIKTPTTDPCAVNLACVSGICQKLCWHDSDCATTAGATCCKASVDLSGGPSGFKMCAACGP